MDYQTVVQEAMYRAGVREDVSTVSVADEGIAADFARWVQDEYRALQLCSHGDRWFWRQSQDETITLADGDFDYSLPAGIKDVNWNTVRVYTTVLTDETFVTFLDYYDFKNNYRTATYEEGRPRFITMTPDGEIWVSPTPDQTYTLAFDGIKALDTVSVDGDTFEVPEDYQYLLVWGAVKRFAKHHEDSSKLADAQSEYRPIFDAMTNRQTPNSRVVVGQMYGTRRLYGA